MGKGTGNPEDLLGFSFCAYLTSPQSSILPTADTLIYLGSASAPQFKEMPGSLLPPLSALKKLSPDTKQGLTSFIFCPSWIIAHHYLMSEFLQCLVFINFVCICVLVYSVRQANLVSAPLFEVEAEVQYSHGIFKLKSSTIEIKTQKIY